MKYLVLDFGGVLAYPTTGYWFVTPCFMETISLDVKIDKVLEVMSHYNYILSSKMETLEEEYQMFSLFYDKTLKELGYSSMEKEIKKIAYDFVYQDGKYKFYEGVETELKELSEKYTLLMLSDNWPCVYHLLKDQQLDQYFDKLYVSSIYGEEKKNGRFFDFPIEDYGIKEKEALFIDDNEHLLDIAFTKGYEVRRMDREHEKTLSKHKVIHHLRNL